MAPKDEQQSDSNKSNKSTMSRNRNGQERQPSGNHDGNQSTIAAADEVERLQSTDNSSKGAASHESRLQAKNEELRRLLMDAQELLVQRNERLANLECQIQSLNQHTQRPENRSEEFHAPEAITYPTPSLALLQVQISSESESSLKVYDEAHEGSSDHENEPSTTRPRPSKTLQTCGSMCDRGKIRRLPREQELETRVEVVETRIVDGAGDDGVYTGSLLNELPHGKGRMVYDKYRSYMGEWKGGHWHGKGHVMSRAFDFKGVFVDDLKDGLGIMKWSDGRVYKGEFRKDEMHGQGLLVYPDGSAYKGEFHHGKREGKGEARFSGNGQYVGYWKEGVFHGRGQCTWPDGSVYLGNWNMGKTHGQGIELRADGSVRHAGLFENDEPMRRQPNRTIYDE
jgi:hypothetical protein